jgi:hypothetical protein
LACEVIGRLAGQFRLLAHQIKPLKRRTATIGAADYFARRDAGGRRCALAPSGRSSRRGRLASSLEVMDRDARRMRGVRPFVFAELRAGKGVEEIADFIARAGGLTGEARTVDWKPAAIRD